MSNAHHDDRLDLDELDERLTAVERALTDGDEREGAGEYGATLAAIEERLEALESQVTDLDAATQALRGYVGNVRNEDREIERRADAALAKAESLEARLDGEAVADAVDGRRSEVTTESPNRASGDDAAPPTPNGAGGPDAATAAGGRCEQCGAVRDDGTPDGARDHSRGGTAHREDDRRVGEPERHGRRGRESRSAGTGAGRSECGDSTREDAADDESGGLFASLRESL